MFILGSVLETVFGLNLGRILSEQRWCFWASCAQLLRVYAHTAGCILILSLGGSFKLAGLGTWTTQATAAQGGVWNYLSRLKVTLYCAGTTETQMTPLP